jgi:adenylate kinase family enzyme
LTIVGRTLVANRLLAGSACGKRRRGRPLNSVVRRLGKGNVKKVAVFGNTGGGKSTLAKRVAELTRIPLYPLDMIQYRAGGAKVPHDEYLKAHAELLERDAWIIDGYGCRKSAWERFACADTLVYIDLPLFAHFLRVTKRLFKRRGTRSLDVAQGAI